MPPPEQRIAPAKPALERRLLQHAPEARITARLRRYRTSTAMPR